MKELVKVVSLDTETIVFSDGSVLTSEHDSDCCESHYLSMGDLTLKDFEGLEFDLSNDNFFNRIEDYGIELVPVKGWAVKIPGYGYNNGYYSSELTLELRKAGEVTREFDITECQVISD